MLLTRLVELHQARAAAQAAEKGGTQTSLPPTYQIKPVPWVINLDADGRFLGPTRTSGTTAGRGRDRGREMAIPALATKRASNVAAVLLADRADYALGLMADDLDERAKGRVIDGHAQFVGLVQRCAAETAEPPVRAVNAFLQSLDRSTLGLPAELNPRDSVTFAVDGIYPIDLPRVREWWRREVVRRDTAEDVGRLLLAPRTGKTAAVRETQPETFYAATLTASVAVVAPGLRAG